MINLLLNKKELIFIKFPIIFPIVYVSVLYLFPNLESELIFITILLLAETHFGATWPFLLNKVNFNYIKEKKVNFIIIPALIVLLSAIGFFFIKNFFLLIFFTANVFHVTRQSFGVCKLYCKNITEVHFQEFFIYLFNILFFLVALFRFYLPIINESNLLHFNIIVLLILFSTFVFYMHKFKFTENFLTFCTGCLIFYPACFVSNPVHVILMGVTMHYTQYLYLTHKVYKGRVQEDSKFTLTNIFFNRYFLTIFLYAIIMSVLSIFGKTENDFYKNLIVIPIIGQMLHFYLDSQLWKFSEKHNRLNVLSHIR